MQTSGRLTTFHKSPRIGQRSDEGTLPGIITDTFVLSIIAPNEVDDDAIKKKRKSGQDNARFTCSRNMCALCIRGVIVYFYQKIKFWQNN